MSEIEYLTLEDIIEAHKKGYKEFGGGAPYHADFNCVARRAFDPQAGFGTHEEYPGLFLKAAVYFHRIITSHCFSDGNKRAAILSTDLFLVLNGYELSASEDELFDFALTVADHETRPPVEDVENWIRNHVKPLDFDELSDYL
ncbi:type II toxin-antitoxin system death-on-curing family toxin [Neobacillus sp. YX16]|uniref:type II toxin-antitoxin system death-on-curing family toxin n=1 Tax=Neobacillus sp. YX16 TaxID=3047874 RepID=UPI0024C42066|nr:type II toxin-antitoxin system death-on-curing family toxin [Neobacillus sp. YX16]WHZ03404.1 type II toxin-antitoxin system death-on-curing family toxin [Neobacillus sp. YX16]